MGIFVNGKCRSKARLDGKTAVITGGNAGIGFETAKELLKRGCRVVLACRNSDKAEAAAKKLRLKVPDSHVRVVHLDLASLKSVKHCAELLIITEDHIHLLINNAGLICHYTQTEDGYEMQFQCNHLGHFLFTNLLLDKIKASAPARIINVSSRLHATSGVKFDDLQSTKSYSEISAYAQSKLCNILFTLELQKRLRGSDVVAYALHPGAVATEIGHDELTGWKRFIGTSGSCFKKTPRQGAQTTLHCALDEELAQQNGLYFSDCKEVAPSRKAQNKDDAAKLWHISEELCHTFLH